LKTKSLAILIQLILTSTCLIAATFSDSDSEKTANEKLVRALVIDASIFETNMKYSEALIYYQKALELRPESASLRYLYAKNLVSFAFQTPYKIDFLISAKKSLKSAYEVDSSNIDLLELYGRLLLDSKIPALYSPAEALQVYTRLTTLSDNIAYRHSLALCYESVNNIDKALELYRQIYSTSENFDYAMMITRILYNQDPNNGREFVFQLLSTSENELDLRELADFVIYKKDTSTYSSIVETLYNIDNKNIDYLNAYFQACLDTKHYSSLVAIVKDLESKDLRVDKEQYFFIINGHLFRDSLSLKSNGVEDILELEYSLFPDNIQVNYYAAILAKKGLYSDLEQRYFKRLYSLADTNKELANEIVVLLLQEGKYDETIEKSAYFSTKFPNEWEFKFLQGLAYQNKSEFGKALEIFQNAIEDNERNLYLWVNIGLCASRIGDVNLSDSAYEKAISIDSTMVLALNNYAYSLVERKIELQKALKMSKMAIEKEPENASYLDTYGWILFTLGNYEEAIVYLEKSCATGNASAVVFEHLGDAYRKAGNIEKAKESYRKALELDPDLASTRERLQN